MKKVTLFLFLFGCFLSLNAQFVFNPVTGPINVAAGAPQTVSINDIGNVASVPASSSGTYSSFSISVAWVDGFNAWSAEADISVTTTLGTITIDPATTGQAFNGNATTMTFDGDLPGFYDPTVDGFLELVLNQSFGGSNANWSDITVTIFETPTCPEPSDMMVSGLTENAANLDWSAGNTETTWNIEWNGGADFTPGNAEEEGSDTLNGTPTATLAALTPSTQYFVYYRAFCGTGDESLWVGPVTFTTFNVPPPAPVGVSCTTDSPSFIYTAEFDSFDGWTGDLTTTNQDGFWEIPGDSGSFATGPDNAFSGANYMNYESSGGTTATASAVSPAIDLTTASDGAELSFYMHAFGADMGTLNVGVANSAAGPFPPLFTWVGDLQTAGDQDWVPVGINLDAFLGQVIYVEFSHTGTGDFEGDMSIDFMRVETCGTFCVAPSSIVVTNIGANSADVSWSANNGETSWEYVVQPAGTGEPTGPGNNVATTTITETGLLPSTDYEIYVLANCASGNSSWAGPVNFTTDVQTNFTLDCANDGPFSQNFCYDNDGDDNPVIFTYSSNDGTPLNLIFNSGFVENGWDELVVLDTDGTPFPGFEPGAPGFEPGLPGFGNAGDLGGLTFQSTGDTISFYINSDGSVSCVTGSFGNPLIENGIDFTVSCATCINPQATYAVVDDCANGDQFLIDVVIADLGDATSLTISNNINADTVTNITAPGTFQIGPFPFLQDVVVTVANDQDGNCVINSPAIQLLACPPANDNPCGAVVAAVNPDESCTVTTPGTILAATPSGVPSGSCTGDSDDDVWFEFVAIGDQQIIELQNIAGGTFNLDHALYEGTCDNLTEVYCSSDDFSLTPTLVVGNTYYIRVFSAGSADETSTFDLCISTLGIPTFCLEALPICADANIEYPSVVGDQVAPPYLDYDCLGSQPDPQWNTILFDEAGDYSFSLDQTDEFGVPADIDFIVWGPFLDQETSCTQLLPENIVDCSFSATASETITLTNVPANSIYIILITNFSQDPGTYTFTQDSGPTDGTNCDVVCDVTMVVEGAPIDDDVADLATPDEVLDYCGFDSVNLEATTFYSVDEYIWYFDGFEIPGATSATYIATESGTYQVEVRGGICDASATYFSALVDLNFYADPADLDAQNITVCASSGSDGTEEFDLDQLTTDLTLGPDFTVSYYTSVADANQAINAVSSPYSSSGEILVIRVEDTEAATDGFLGCRELSEVELVVTPRPVINQPVAFIVCDDIDGDVDGTTEFDLTSIDSEVSTDPNVAVSYHASQDAAENNSGALVSPYSSSGETIFVRAEDTTTGCFETTTFDLVVNIVPLAEFSDEFVYAVCPNATVPVSIGISPENFTEAEVTVNWLLDGVAITGSGLTLNNVLVAGDYSAVITFNSSGCVNTITTTVEEEESCIFPQGISPGVSPGQNDTFDLSSFNVTKLEIFNRNGTIVYSKTNYVDEWIGQTNDGEELPVGTYFYTVEYEGGTKSRTGWIYINR